MLKDMRRLLGIAIWNGDVRKMRNNRLNALTTNVFDCWIIIVIYVLAFQSPLERVNSFFKFIDETVAVAGLACWGLISLKQGKFRIKHYVATICIPLLVFVLVGILGDAIYQYQSLKWVLIDLLTNLKFYMALVTGYLLFASYKKEKMSKCAALHLRIITALVFVAFIVERIAPVFGETQVRYGIRSAQMFYFHPTYLAGSMAFLVTAMTVFYEKKNLPFIAAALLIMMFTLRSKAMAVAMIYVVLFLLLVVFKRKLKWWHMGILALIALLVGGPLFYYYYIELGDASGRAIMTKTSFMVMRDYFPIGTGFGTYGSNAAAESYSPVYVMYGFNDVGDLASWNPTAYLTDTFWPIIIGQTGAIGIVAYLVVLALVFSKVITLEKINTYYFLAGVYIVVFMIVSSVAEPAFNNAVSIPMAVLLGGLIHEVERYKHPNGCKTTEIKLYFLQKK